MSYQDLLAEDRRLSILLLLEAAPAATGNEALLHAALPEFGHSPSLDVVRADLTWLAEAGLVTTRDTHGLAIAALTDRGLDVAQGRARHPGVKRRRP
ncbi:MAG: ArsR family transcriptional regulator [Acetobacteraceae bacterium]|nr:ArsR family transcriptional regulator [Acetobacteraceae bacterium]